VGGFGAQGWDYNSVLPYFRRNECYLGGGEDEFRGRQGRLPINVMPRQEALCDAYINGAVEVGFERNLDYNGRSQAGVGYTQATIHKGKRWSAAHSYLHPARRRFGVRVITSGYARRIVVENGRAIGVDFCLGDDPTIRSLRARVATIVSAGTVNTTRLLQLSGIGPGGLLQQLGISVVSDIPGLGRNLSDHYAARLVARAYPGVDTVNGRASGLPLVKEVMAWMLGRPSILAMSTAAVYAFGKTDPHSPDNQYALTFTPASFKEGMTRQLDDVPG
jgi:choline dehydrogenase